MMRVSFFFPMYNDERTVEPLARLADEVLSSCCDEHEIIMVNDASPDGAGAIADRLAAENPRFRVVHHPVNRGYGQAVWSGIQAARYEWIAFTDGDMQYDVRELPKLIEVARSGVDVVGGYKTRRAEGWRRTVTSRLYNGAIRVCFGIGLRDIDCAFKVMHRRVFEDFVPSMHYTEAFILVEALYRAQRRGIEIREVPVSHHERRFGDSQCFTWRTTRRLALNTARGFVVGRVLGAWR